ATPPVTKQAFGLIDKATGHVARTRPWCAPKLSHAPAKFVDGAAGPQVSSVLGVFRRPANAADQAAAAAYFADPGFDPFFAEVPRDGIRVVHSADGTAFTLIAATKLRRFGPAPEKYDACQQATRRWLVHIARSATPAVRHSALKNLDALTRSQRPAPSAQQPTEGLELDSGHGGGGGPFDAARFVARPFGMTSGTGGGASRLALLLPDGVARVDLTFDRYSSRGPGRGRIDHGHQLHISRAVTENVVAVSVPHRAAESALPATIVERAADGSVVRTIHAP
ncbi:MAG TPA: hypothetical protein VGF63_08825, partial [Solirubrobacteraceae bacterium]